MIPEQQFGFRKNRSSQHAVQLLITNIEEAIPIHKGKYYAVFVDFSKAFDQLDRTMLKGKLEKTIKNKHLTTILIDIMSYNKVQIDDGKSSPKK